MTTILSINGGDIMPTTENENWERDKKKADKICIGIALLAFIPAMIYAFQYPCPSCTEGELLDLRIQLAFGVAYMSAVAIFMVGLLLYGLYVLFFPIGQGFLKSIKK